MKRLHAIFQRTRRRAPMLTSQSAYALWADAYPPYAHNPLMQAEENAMLTLMPDLTDKRVLDIGAGSGRYTRIAHERHVHSILSLDDSLPMLHAGIATYPIQASANALPLSDNCADVALCALMIGHLPDPAPVLAEIARVLVSDGIALISDFHPDLARQGAQRTFEHEGKHYAVEHYVHSIALMRQLADANHLTVDAIHEPTLQKNGHQLPVVVVYRLLKIKS